MYTVVCFDAVPVTVRTVDGMFRVVTATPDRLEYVLNRLSSLGFEVFSVMSSASSSMLAGGGPVTEFTVVVRGDGHVPSDVKPEEPAW